MEASDSSRSSLQPHAPAALNGADPNDDAAGAAPASDLSALSRFEFETGKGGDGTKVLLVEWDPALPNSESAPSTESPPQGRPGPAPGQDAPPETVPGDDWQVSWEGRSAVLPIGDRDVGGSRRRVYFLLPPGASIPPFVTITHASGATLTTRPLPAIFPAGLGIGRGDSGTRGVLHTLWAKKRLSELEDEIKIELASNGESVGAEMAIQERSWLVGHFGIGSPEERAAYSAPTTALANPLSPRSPPSGRLGEKLRGLRLATSPTDLARPAAAGTIQPLNVQVKPLSPDPAGAAVTCPPTLPTLTSQTGQRDRSAHPSSNLSNGHGTPGEDRNTEDDLFALPMSPRSPEMKRSPFSFL